MAKGTVKRPGYAAVQTSIARREGILGERIEATSITPAKRKTQNITPRVNRKPGR